MHVVNAANPGFQSKMSTVDGSYVIKLLLGRLEQNIFTLEQNILKKIIKNSWEIC